MSGSACSGQLADNAHDAAGNPVGADHDPNRDRADQLRQEDHDAADDRHNADDRNPPGSTG
jgi:hypothetical protein